MHTDKYLKSYGLMEKHRRTLRALFEAGVRSVPAAAWVYSPANAGALAELVRAGLVSEKSRLTLPGLAVAASLLASARCRRLEAA